MQGPLSESVYMRWKRRRTGVDREGKERQQQKENEYSRARVGVVVHEDIDGAFDERGADAATESRVYAAYDLYFKGATIGWLSIELCDSRLCVLFMLVGQTDDGVGRVGVEDGGGDGSAALENCLEE